MKDAIKLFQDHKIRVEWDSDKEKWYFSIVDVVTVLTDNNFQGARNYWKVLKHRLKQEGNQTVTNCNQLKLLAPDGKLRSTDVADTEQLLRLIQTIPSKKAEPFKMWLARVGKERIDETEDPELSIDRKASLIQMNSRDNKEDDFSSYIFIPKYFKYFFYTICNFIFT
ncbi:MAG: Bro-N domain-containing protein [Nanoarchaeota archaeon]|nr:Bro-N domain-containing protein [Nanoarchaeota archaeon]MBU1030995.1 Bro-N domain-containing protein [Nanoarchaeota archaeon]MBU1849658.1 Bro-N domain-containing protein [Nanoarchaeota archaeon]